MALCRFAWLVLIALPSESRALEAGNYDDPTLPATLMVNTARAGPDRLFENVRIAKPGCLGAWTIVFSYNVPKTYAGQPLEAQRANGSGVIDCAGVTTRLVGIGADPYTSTFSYPLPNQIVQDMATGWGGTFRMRSGALVGISGRASPFTDAQLRLTIRVATNRPSKIGRVQTMTLRDFIKR